MIVLKTHPSSQGTEVVAKMQFSGGLDARQDAGPVTEEQAAGVGCRSPWNPNQTTPAQMSSATHDICLLKSKGRQTRPSPAYFWGPGFPGAAVGRPCGSPCHALTRRVRIAEPRRGCWDPMPPTAFDASCVSIALHCLASAADIAALIGDVGGGHPHQARTRAVRGPPWQSFPRPIRCART